ncbi:MAG TPA: hypothetical protein VNH64_06525 [Parvularculaceae bacterium]|nr:hypothetical protein [Parvularculaceae bacterium]
MAKHPSQANNYRPGGHGRGDDPALSKPLFRVMRLGEASQALKLEPFWWAALEDMAERRKQSPAELVFALIAPLPEGTNKTAHLRRCIGWDLLESGRRLAGGHGATLHEMAKAAPAPALIVSAENGVEFVNDPALNELERRLLRHERPNIASIQFVNKAEVNSLFATLRAAAPLAVTFPIRIELGSSILAVSLSASLFAAATTERQRLVDWAFCFLNPAR